MFFNQRGTEVSECLFGQKNRFKTELKSEFAGQATPNSAMQMESCGFSISASQRNKVCHGFWCQKYHRYVFFCLPLFPTLEKLAIEHGYDVIVLPSSHDSEEDVEGLSYPKLWWKLATSRDDCVSHVLASYRKFQLLRSKNMPIVPTVLIGPCFCFISAPFDYGFTDW